MKKLNVATRTRESDRKIKKIYEAIGSHPEGTTPKTISRETNINVNTVKNLLPKIQGIKKLMRGFYSVVERGDGAFFPQDIFDWNFHNLILSSKVLVPSVSFEKIVFLGLVRCHLFLSRSGKVTLRVSSDYPLNVSSLCVVVELFKQFLLPYSGNKPVSSADVFVKSIEFNKDYSNLRLDGVNCITVDSLISQFKAYQKKRGLRLEHKLKVPFTVENLMSLLSQPPLSIDANVKLDEQQRLLSALSKKVEQLSQALLLSRGV